MRKRARRPLFPGGAAAITVAALGVVLAGCGGDNGDPAAPGSGGITLAVGATQVTVVQGGSATVNVLLTRTGNFTGPVTVTAQGLPTGVTAQAATVAAGQTSGAIELSAAPTAATGTATVTVQAAGAGVSPATAQLQLTVTDPPSFSFALAAQSVSVAAGGSGSVGLQITRTGGFTGGIGFAVTGLPTGLTAAVDPSPATGNAATLNLSAVAGVAPGDYDLTVRATATGVPERTASLRVTVTGAPGSFTLSVSPATLTVPAGGQGTATVTVTREGGFTGPVSLSGTAPAGVTLSFEPQSVTGTTSTVTVQVAQGTPAGSVTATVSGAAEGVEAREAALSVQVTAVSGPGNVTWAFCPATGGIPVWVAVQDGDGPWTPVPVVDGQASFRIDSGRGGITYIHPLGSVGFSTVLFLGTTAELQMRPLAECGSAEGDGKTVNGTILGVGPTDMAWATLGTAVTSLSGAQGTTAVTFQDVPAGAVDLIAARSRPEQGGGSRVDRLIIRRGLDPAPGSALAAIDFASAEAFEPVTAMVTVNNAQGQQIGVSSALRTANNTFGTFFSDLAESTGTTQPYWGVPANRRVPGDLHQLFITTSAPTFDRFRLASVIFEDVRDRTLDLGPDLAAPTLTTAQTSPYVILQASLPRQPEYDDAFVLQVLDVLGGRSVLVLATRGYLGSADPAVLRWGNYSGLAGFDSAWLPQAGQMMSWQVSAIGLTVGSEITNPWVDGTTWGMGIRAGAITP